MPQPSQSTTNLSAVFNYDLHTVAKQIFDAHARTFVTYLETVIASAANDRCLSSPGSPCGPNSELNRILSMVCLVDFFVINCFFLK